jgi:hypothetical protein
MLALVPPLGIVPRQLAADMTGRDWSAEARRAKVAANRTTQGEVPSVRQIHHAKRGAPAGNRTQIDCLGNSSSIR